MNILKKIDDKFEEYLMVALVAVMTTLIFVQVVFRYVFNSSIGWSEELARYIFLWSIWLGASYGVKTNGHIRLTVLSSHFSKSVQKVVGIVVYLIWFAFILFLVIKGGELSFKLLQSGSTAIATHIPMWIPYASVPVGSILMIIRMIQNAKALVEGIGNTDQEEVL